MRVFKQKIKIIEFRITKMSKNNFITIGRFSRTKLKTTKHWNILRLFTLWTLILHKLRYNITRIRLNSQCTMTFNLINFFLFTLFILNSIILILICFKSFVMTARPRKWNWSNWTLRSQNTLFSKTLYSIHFVLLIKIMIVLFKYFGRDSNRPFSFTIRIL